MKNSFAAAVALPIAAMLSACSPDKPPVEAPRPVRTAEIRYDAIREANRYAGNVQSRFEVDHAFRVGGNVARRLVDVGQFVHEGDVLAVLDDADYRLAEEAARQQHAAAVTQARQADSDRLRLGDLAADAEGLVHFMPRLHRARVAVGLARVVIAQFDGTHRPGRLHGRRVRTARTEHRGDRQCDDRGNRVLQDSTS